MKKKFTFRHKLKVFFLFIFHPIQISHFSLQHITSPFNGEALFAASNPSLSLVEHKSKHAIDVAIFLNPGC